MSDESTEALDRDIDSIEPIDVVIRSQPPAKYEYRRIINETPKSWLLDNIVYVPKWLDDKIWAGLWAEMEKQMENNSCPV